MKKTIKTFAICTMAVSLILTGCSKEENSSLNIEDVKTTTIIMGSVEAFRTQIDPETSTSTQVAVPTNGKKVFVGVPNGNFTGTSGSQGYQWYETTVDSRGQYRIEVPVVGSAQVQVYAEPFTGTTQVLVGTQIETRNVLFNVAHFNLNVTARNSQVRNITYALASFLN